jgi:hypothetical protein
MSHGSKRYRRRILKLGDDPYIGKPLGSKFLESLKQTNSEFITESKRKG